MRLRGNEVPWGRSDLREVLDDQEIGGVLDKFRRGELRKTAMERVVDPIHSCVSHLDQIVGERTRDEISLCKGADRMLYLREGLPEGSGKFRGGRTDVWAAPGGRYQGKENKPRSSSLQGRSERLGMHRKPAEDEIAGERQDYAGAFLLRKSP